MSLATTAITVLDDFDHPSLDGEAWDALIVKGPAHHQSLRWHELRNWWEDHGAERKLLLVVAERDGQPCAVAPLSVGRGLVSFLGTGSVDYVDFIGDISSPGTLAEMLSAAAAEAPGFSGFSFYYLPDSSPTARLLPQAAQELGLSCHEEDRMLAPAVDLAGQPEVAWALANKKRILTAERRMRAEAPLEVLHLTDGSAIAQHFDEFFAQHRAQWARTSTPSRYEDVAGTERFKQRIINQPDASRRFTRIDWNQRPMAFHYGKSFLGRYSWGTTSYALDVARFSPGMILLRHVLLDAIAEGARTFDFGLGDEPYKLRFATHVETVHGFGLYPRRDM